MQWHAEFEDRIFINPGSCGLALDGILGAPYTLLEIDNGQIQVTERRVGYDVDRLISELKSSSLFQEANVWSNIIKREVSTGFECIQFFLQYVNEYANSVDDHIRPYTQKTWQEAYEQWRIK